MSKRKNEFSSESYNKGKENISNGVPAILNTNASTNITTGHTNVRRGRRPLSTITNVVVPTITQDQARHSRKIRKVLLDNKRSKLDGCPSNVDHTMVITTDSIPSPSIPTITQKLSALSADNSRFREVNLENTTSPLRNSISYSNRSIHRSPDIEATPNVITNRTASFMGTSNLSCVTNNGTPPADATPGHIASNITSFSGTSGILQNSSFERLSSGKRKLIGRPRITSPIPIIDFTTEQIVVQDPLKGVSKDYLDHGDQCVTCEVCNAKLWNAEKGKGRKKDGKVCYFICCSYGIVELPDYKDARGSYRILFTNNGDESKHFLKNIRRYNSMFAFTSMGGKVDSTVNRGNGPFCFRISGENYHTIGSLMPINGAQPKFCQLYIYDTENEISNRQSIFRGSDGASSSSSANVDIKLIEHIKDVLDNDNELVKTYRRVRDSFQDNPNVNVKLRIIGAREKDGRTYNLPTAGEIAALIVGDIENVVDNRDIIVETRTGELKRISELHPSYLALQYPILFPYGDDGYRIDIPHRGVVDVVNKTRPKCTMREFFAYRIQDRINQFSLILNSKRLFQQFLVDAYTMIESERLRYIRYQQKDLRSDTYESLRKLRSKGQDDISKAGKRIFLPSSFTGGARYMMQNYLDAMALCKCFGYPDYFITITCNPKWPEVQRFLKDTNLSPEDRPDILSRLFKIKLDSICKDLKKNHLLDKASAVVYTIEFQKRGLPHAHLCLFMEPEFKLPTVDHVDSFISAEIPNREEDPELFILVKEYMIHGPCGNARLSSPCMVDMKCSKGFPKKFQDHTTLDSNGFPLYRRRNNGSSVVKNKIELDNRSVVPYNKKLLKRYQAHINVEWCNQVASIKYLFKYINKGPDRATIAVARGDSQPEEQPQDEIKEYYDCRYISACEASWRIFANELDKRVWEPRKGKKSIGRIHSVSPTLGEAYFLRILLNKVRGPTSFDDIKTVNGKVYDTYRDACYALGLLDDDSEYVEAIKEANLTGSASYIRNLFSTMLLSGSLSRPEVVWETSWRYMADDFVYRLAKYHRVTALSIPDHQLKNYVLVEIEKFLLRNNSSLRRFESMPYPDMSSSEIMAAVNSDNGQIFFLYGYGGTGKTFLWKTLSAAIRSRGQIVLNVASSGIASLLLDGGRTAHSRFSIPLNLTEDSVCHIKPESDLAKLLHETKLIIWDEAPMVHKHAFEALDRTMNDVFNIDTSLNSEIRFGGKVIVFGGDFRQILPVVPNGGRQEIVNASLCSSYLWSKCKLLRLTRNMRLTVGRSTADVDEINSFGKWLLDLGEGNVGGPNDGEATIEIPRDLLITDPSDPIGSLIDFVYPSILENVDAHNYFSDRAILAPKNEVVHEINDRLLAMFPGEEKEYLSSDSLCPSEDVNSTQQRLYSPDVLNGLKISGLPNHRLVLKVGVPVMLLRNIDQRNGLCNGTRLQVKKLHNRVIEAEIISGSNIGTCTYIPRLNLIPSDKKIPFSFQRRQFPLAVCFAMTINKSQGQSLSRVGLYLKQPVFSHGQLYVALSRVKTRNGVKILILDNNGKPTEKTTNVVYKEIFNDL
ncbi:uncharacterized protein LOC110931184 [Helianthus annuus]|uniref:uncharacterized protein LOC110931184 n=1 Tax=Helianthus annuus TaxID=4232 RepID=UPI0016533189|nr:uncharacterized protein LOC110931184 [Helianthus annuus]